MSQPVGQDINTNVVLTSDISGYTQGMRQAGTETANTQSQVDSLIGSLDKLRNNTKTGLKIFAAADFAVLAGATKTAADFDKQLSTLRATAAVTGQDFGRTTKSVNELRRELPMTTREIASLMEQLKSMGTDEYNVQEYVESFKRLSLSTGESITGLASGMVGLRQQMATPTTAISGMSDTVAALSANLDVSATGMLGYAQSIAPVARVVGMTTDEVLGYSAAFARTGQDGFVAANAMTDMVDDIARATRYGSRDLEKYAEAAGMTVSAFSDLSASDQFLKIVQEVNRAGPDAIRLLDRMGYDGTQLAPAIQNLSRDGQLGEALEQAGLDNTGAALRGSQSATDNLHDSVSRLTDSLRMLGETLGGPLADGASKFVDLLTSMAQVAEKAITPLEPVLGAAGAVAGAGAAFLGSNANIVGPLITAATAMSFMNGPLRGGFQYARHGRGEEALGRMSPRLRTGVESTLAGRAGPLQRAMFTAGMLGGGAMYSTVGAGGSAMRSNVRDFQRASTKFFTENPRMSQAMDRMRTSWDDLRKSNEARGTRAGTTGPRGSFGARAAMAAAATASWGGAMFNQQFEGLTAYDYTDRAMRNTRNVGSPGLYRSAWTGRNADGTPVTTRGAMREVGRAGWGVARETARAGGAAIGAGARGVGRLGLAGLGALGLSPAMLGIGGAAALGGLLYSTNKTGQERMEATTGGPLNTALNVYAERLGLAGESALSFADATDAAAAQLTDSSARRATEEDESRIRSGGYELTDTYLGHLTQQQATERMRTTFGVPGVDPQIMAAARDDLVYAYGAETAQEIINQASQGLSTTGGLENLTANTDIWAGLGHVSTERSEEVGAAIGAAQSQRSEIQGTYGADSDAYRQTQSDQAMELMRQLQTSTRAGASAESEQLAAELADITGMDMDEILSRLRRRPMHEYMGDDTSAYTDEELREILVEASREQGSDFESILEAAAQGGGPTTISMEEGFTPLALEAVRGGIHGDIWTGRNQNLYESVTFGNRAEDPDVVARAQDQLLRDVVSRVQQETGFESTDPRLLNQTLPEMFRAMGTDPNSPVYQLYQGALGRQQVQRQYQMGVSDPMAQYQNIMSNYQQMQQAYEQNPRVPGAYQAMQAAEQEYQGARSSVYDRLLSWKRAQEDLQYQRGISTEDFQRNVRWQQEDRQRQIGYSYEDFGISRGRAREDYALSRQRSQEDFDRQRDRAEEDFARQRRWNVEDYYREMGRQEEDYQISRNRAEFDFQLQRSWALEDYNLSRTRQEEDFNHQQVLLARQTARSMQDIYSRMTIQRTWDAENLLVNSQEQLVKMGQHQQGLESLRGMGVSSDAIKALNLTDFQMVDQVNRLVSDLSRDPALVKQLNEQIKARMQYGLKNLTDIDNEAYQESMYQYELGRKRQEEDFEKSQKRQEDMFTRSMDRQESDYRKSIRRSEADFNRSLKRNDENFKRSLSRNDEDFGISMARQAADFAKMMDRQGDDFARSMRRNEEQWAISLARNTETWQLQLKRAEEQLNRSFRITTGTFQELSDTALGTMTGTTLQQYRILAKGMSDQGNEIRRKSKQLAIDIPKWMAPLFGGQKNFRIAVKGGAFGDLKIPTSAGSKGGPDNTKQPADLASYQKVLDSKKLPSTVGGGGAVTGGGSAVAGGHVHPLAGQSFYVSSPYGARRSGYVHNGTDMAAAGGTPVKSYAGGVVKSAAWSAQSGNVIAIDHGGGYETRYHHLSRMNVKNGDVVQAGSKIGNVGSTGWNSTGNHLHFSVYVNGRTVDPMPYLRGTQRFSGSARKGGGKVMTTVGGGGAGDIDRFLYALRMVESGNNYRARSPISSASGAYQYIDGTWGGYGGYARAYLAPASVQDARARRDVMARYRQYGNWEQVAAAHMYPAWAGNRSLWNRVAAPGNPTLAQYVAKVMGYMSGGGFTGAEALTDVWAPTKAQILQAIVQGKTMRQTEDAIGFGPLGHALPRGRTSMGLASTWAGHYDRGISDNSLKGTDWFARGGVVNKHTNAVLGERGPEVVMPLDEHGAQFVASVLGKMQHEVPVEGRGGSQVGTVVNNYYQQIDSGTHLHGKVTVMANDTSTMYKGLEQEARRERLMAR